MNTRKVVIFAALFCILVSMQVSSAFAKPILFPELVTISGDVSDECSGTGIYGATVRLYDELNRLLDTVTTDSNGHYSGLAGYGLGFTVKCSKAGYTTETKSNIVSGTHVIDFVMDDPEKIAFIVYDQPAPGYDPIDAWLHGDTSDGFLSGTYVNDHLVPLLYDKGFDIVETFPDPANAPYLYPRLREIAGHCDWVMLFVSGHGTYTNGESKIDVGNFYITSDTIAEFDDPSSFYYIPSSHFFLFVDGCYSGDFETVLANTAKATVVTSCHETLQGTFEDGSWGTRGSFTHDFFFNPDPCINPEFPVWPRSIALGYTIQESWRYIYSYTLKGILTLPQYSDSDPSDDDSWFYW